MANPEAGCTPPHDAHAPHPKDAPPPSVPIDPRKNAWPQSRMYIPLLPAPESALPSASSRRHPAAEYSSPHSRSAAQAHRAHPPRALPPLPRPRSSPPAPHSTMDHSQISHTADPQTRAASSSSPPHPPFSAPTVASAHKSSGPSAHFPRSGGNSGIYPGESEPHPYSRWARP